MELTSLLVAVAVMEDRRHFQTGVMALENDFSSHSNFHRPSQLGLF